ncbi:PAQR family membrane homeostasis protein TrhA [Nocardioides gilvus]|uniref:PAQR family membrane homeostasis protein TrhA n=1 Tax=Nocardioides gilvus TaxID=1735589 RepID=UPI000D74BC66|nr:hemolysin III family protein [Nocardioides gilvus]
MNDSLRLRVDHLHDRVEDTLAEVKPKLRGWLHAGTVPLALVAGITLIALSPSTQTRIASTIFAFSALLVFTVSAIYHRGHWSPRVRAALQRFDHSNIFILIAGTCTPFAVLLLQGSQRWWMLGVVWGGAVAGVLMKVWWTSHPRWVSVPIYMALGWAPVFFFGGFLEGAQRYGETVGATVITLVVVGGALYTVGGVIYGTKRPNPSPRWFGFHEVFHSLTILAFVTHYVGVSLATYSLR